MTFARPASARWVGVAAVALAFALIAGPSRPHTARADTTNMAVIACENLAPYLDGDAGDTTTQADLDAACLQPLPPTGAVSVASLEDGIGAGDGVLTYFDVILLDGLDHNRIPADCTYAAVVTNATKAAAGCTLVVMVFVDDESPVTLDLPSTLASIETGGDVVCNSDGSGAGVDDDCSDAVAGNGDGVVVFHVLNATGADGENATIAAIQEAVEQTASISISSETRDDPSGDIDGDGVLYPDDNCPLVANADQTNTDSAPLVTPGVAPVDTSIANGDGLGDACDGDIDNDGLLNYQEIEIGESVPPPSGPFCHYAYYPGGTNPQAVDTDGDAVTDYAECQLDTDPTNAASKPGGASPDADGDGLSDSFEATLGSDPNLPDTDGDGITDGVEFKGYNTSLTEPDTDHDGCSDGAEITSVDANPGVNSLDLLTVARQFLKTGKPALDINKDGAINSLDLLVIARNFDPAACSSVD